MFRVKNKIRGAGRANHKIRDRSGKFKVLIERIRLKSRPVRTSKNPVKVVFVCDLGGTSGTFANIFREALREGGIKSIEIHNLEFRREEHRKVLEDADIVLHLANNVRASNAQMRPYAKKGCIIGSFYDYAEVLTKGDKIDFSGLFDLIGRKFSLEEKQ
jgi:mannitol-specific phosphotransferase system IIBC component